MMKRIYVLLTALCTAAALNAPAQTEAPKDELTGSGRHSIALGPLTWVNGYTAVYYEQAIGSKLGLQLGAGVTTRSYLNDLGAMIWQDGAKNSVHFTEAEDVADHYEYYKNRKTLPGFYCSFAPKFYSVYEAMNSTCVFPMLEFKSYRFRSKLVDPRVYPETSGYNPGDERDIARSDATVNERVNCFDITLNIGRTYQLRHRLALAWNAGIGARYLSEQRMDIGKLNYASGSVYRYLTDEISFSKARPVLTFNLTVGGWY